MGIEYKIRFAVPPGFSGEGLAARLPDATVPNSAWVEYAYAVEADGFSFVDHTAVTSAPTASTRDDHARARGHALSAGPRLGME